MLIVRTGAVPGDSKPSYSGWFSRARRNPLLILGILPLCVSCTNTYLAMGPALSTQLQYLAIPPKIAIYFAAKQSDPARHS
jgi:hypothetical protein